jgi:hypothetical protein
MTENAARYQYRHPVTGAEICVNPMRIIVDKITKRFYFWPKAPGVSGIGDDGTF